MKNFNGIRTTRYTLEGAVCLVFFLMCACLYGQDIPGTGATNDPKASQQPTLGPPTGDAAPSAPEGTAVVDEDPDIVPKQAPVTPNVDHETASSDDVYTIHLRPLFATVVRLPEEVTSLAVGAPTLIAAEHDKSEPRLVFIKPMTEKKVDSNVVVALRSGRTLSIRVISAGEMGSTDPVDFVVDYSQPHNLMLADTPIDSGQPIPQTAISAPAGRTAPMPESHRPDRPARQHSRSSNSSTIVTDSTPVARAETPVHSPARAAPVSTLDALYQEQLKVAAPHYTTAEDLARLYPEDKFASRDLSASLGRSVQEGDSVTVSYSVLNRSGRWIEVLPPLLEFNNPAKSKKNGKVDKKHPEALAEQLPISDYRMSKMKLAPGERLDGAVEFDRPGFKYKKERLLLQIANASEVDTALMVPVPFVPAER
jgi:hypothetical protein